MEHERNSKAYFPPPPTPLLFFFLIAQEFSNQKNIRIKNRIRTSKHLHQSSMLRKGFLLFIGHSCSKRFNYFNLENTHPPSWGCLLTSVARLSRTVVGHVLQRTETQSWSQKKDPSLNFILFSFIISVTLGKVLTFFLSFSELICKMRIRIFNTQDFNEDLKT